MAYTTLETELISRLRKKIGDNPTAEGVADPSKQIWSDDEMYTELLSSRVQLFKGNRTSYEALSDVEQEMILLQTAASLVTTLAVNSARYAKYSIREVNVERLSPSEFLRVAEAFDARLKKLADESGSDEMGLPVIQQNVIKLYDRRQDLFVPTRYIKSPGSVPFSLTNVSTGIQIQLSDVFLPTYHRHWLKKSSAVDAESILYSWDVLSPVTVIDTAVRLGMTYTYTMCIEDMNGQVSQASKSITYEFQLSPNVSDTMTVGTDAVLR